MVFVTEHVLTHTVELTNIRTLAHHLTRERRVCVVTDKSIKVAVQGEILSSAFVTLAQANKGRVKDEDGDRWHYLYMVSRDYAKMLERR
jgi:hypothetical protein